MHFVLLGSYLRDGRLRVFLLNQWNITHAFSRATRSDCALFLSLSFREILETPIVSSLAILSVFGG